MTQNSSNCVFCKIISGQLAGSIIAEDENVIVIKDRAPKAPVHYLIIPKKHIESIRTLEQQDAHIPGAMFLMAQQLSDSLSGSKSFRTIINSGADAGQSVFHMHMHFLSGKQMLDF